MDARSRAPMNFQLGECPGERGQPLLARDLGVADRNRCQWIAGHSPIPDGSEAPELSDRRLFLDFLQNEFSRSDSVCRRPCDENAMAGICMPGVIAGRFRP
jgi:hypothetical protein